MSAASRMKHIVMFGFRIEVTQTQIQSIREKLLALPTQIPSIRAYELGVDLLLPEGQAHPAGPNRRISWTCEFDSVSDFNGYQDHVAHQAFLKDLKPLVLPGSRAAIQYECK